MKCIIHKCTKNSKYFLIQKENAIVPTDCQTGDVQLLCSYFQYKAPNIDSLTSPFLRNVEFHKEILIEMLSVFKGNFSFISERDDIENEFLNYKLNGNNLCACCKRFVCKKSNTLSKRDSLRKETELECFLRHTRNAIAHGNVYVIHNKTYIYICFEDLNKNKKPTARIICTQADLKKWKKILELSVENERGFYE